MISKELKVREFYKDELLETFADESFHLREFILNLEKSPTSILEMSDVMEARSCKEFYLAFWDSWTNSFVLSLHCDFIFSDGRFPVVLFFVKVEIIPCIFYKACQ
jgi:hypothetical protein